MKSSGRTIELYWAGTAGDDAILTCSAQRLKDFLWAEEKDIVYIVCESRQFNEGSIGVTISAKQPPVTRD